MNLHPCSASECHVTDENTNYEQLIQNLKLAWSGLSNDGDREDPPESGVFFIVMHFWRYQRRQ